MSVERSPKDQLRGIIVVLMRMGKDQVPDGAQIDSVPQTLHVSVGRPVKQVDAVDQGRRRGSGSTALLGGGLAGKLRSDRRRRASPRRRPSPGCESARTTPLSLCITLICYARSESSPVDPLEAWRPPATNPNDRVAGGTTRSSGRVERDPFDLLIQDGILQGLTRPKDRHFRARRSPSPLPSVECARSAPPSPSLRNCQNRRFEPSLPVQARSRCFPASHRPRPAASFLERLLLAAT